jgi:hypothetical protein
LPREKRQRNGGATVAEGQARVRRSREAWCDPVEPVKNKAVRGRARDALSAILTGQSASVGLPRAWNVFFSCSRSVSPARKGTRSMSSAKMQPTDQMSTAPE